MKVELGPHERLDDLCLDGMKIIQRDDEFCFSLDTVVLAHFGAVPKGHILDMGTGTAAIPLILAARGARQITAVELNPVMADIARRNIALNGKGHCITVKEGDYRHIREWVESGSFDTIYVNPPYREKSRGAYSDMEGIRRARHEETATLQDVMTAASYALRFHGRFRMVHIAERLSDIMTAMRSVAIEPKCLRVIHGKAGKDAKLFLVEGIRGGHAGLQVAPPLFVHDDDGSYGSEILAMYGKT